MLTGAGIVYNEVCPKQNDIVVVIGVGGVGLSALLALASLKVEKIIAVDISDEKLELARAFGATNVVNASRGNAKPELLAATDGGANYCIECAGSTNTIQLGLDVVSYEGGELIFASHPAQNESSE